MLRFLLPPLLLAPALFAQTPDLTLPVADRPLEGAWADLRLAPDAFAGDPAREEAVVDLVEAWTVDSTYRRKTERHQMTGAALFRVFGVRWKTVRHTRERVVGQVARQSISGKERFTEYDVNFDLVPHRPRSLEVVYAGYAAREPMFKARRAVTPGEPPYVPPGPGIDPQPYRIHVECTPARGLRDALDSAFYPTRRPHDLATHPNVGRAHPVIGVYGPLVLDCNHSCWPEIHPYEWIWWRTGPSAEGAPPAWSVGLLRDVSNRMKHWSHAPREGAVSLPFAVAFGEGGEAVLRLEAGPRSPFHPPGLQRWPLPERAFPVAGRHLVGLDHPALAGRRLALETDAAWPLDAAAWWVEDLAWDAGAGRLHGRIVVAAAVRDALTFRLLMP